MTGYNLPTSKVSAHAGTFKGLNRFQSRCMGVLWALFAWAERQLYLLTNRENVLRVPATK
jgi:hypothetical protein